jgi:spermidine synthase
MVGAHLLPGDILAVQSTSPLVARRSFWCIDRTIRSAGLNTQPYHVFVPSFGEWGFILAAREALPPPDRLRRPVPSGLRFLTDGTLPSLFRFPKDMAQVDDNPVNRLNNQILVRLYDEEWNEID